MRPDLKILFSINEVAHRTMEKFDNSNAVGLFQRYQDARKVDSYSLTGHVTPDPLVLDTICSLSIRFMRT